MLTPLDIESKVFTRTVSGYNISEVKQFMKEILINYEKLYRENIELKDKVNLLNEGIQYYKTIEDTLQSTLLLAERTAEDVKAGARNKSDQIIKEAELKSYTIINDAQAEIYRISKEKESLIRAYDASKIQMRQFLKAQLELTEKTDLELNRKAYENSPYENKEAEEISEEEASDDLKDDLQDDLEKNFSEDFEEDFEEDFDDTLVDFSIDQKDYE